MCYTSLLYFPAKLACFYPETSAAGISIEFNPCSESWNLEFGWMKTYSSPDSRIYKILMS
jgi:hypothetical protein